MSNSNNENNSGNDQSKIIDKIKKLLNLSKSPNPNEAAVAMKMAISLMNKHKITQETIDENDIVINNVYCCVTNAFERMPKYETYFINSISHIFGVRVIYNYVGDKKAYSVYGYKERVDVASYVIEVIARKLKYLRKSFMKTTDFQWWYSKSDKTNAADLYCYGWVDGVVANVDEVFDMSEDENLALDRFTEKQWDDLESVYTRSTKRYINDEDFMGNGYEIGQKEQILNPITGAQRRTQSISYDGF